MAAEHGGPTDPISEQWVRPIRGEQFVELESEPKRSVFEVENAGER